MNTSTLAVCILTFAFGPLASARYSVDWFTIDGGGGISTDGYYEIAGTVGQADTGILSDGYYTVEGGFWNSLTAFPAQVGPGLIIERGATNSVVVSWPAAWRDWQLQENGRLDANTWTNVATLPQEAIIDP